MSKEEKNDDRKPSGDGKEEKGNESQAQALQTSIHHSYESGSITPDTVGELSIIHFNNPEMAEYTKIYHTALQEKHHSVILRQQTLNNVSEHIMSVRRAARNTDPSQGCEVAHTIFNEFIAKINKATEESTSKIGTERDGLNLEITGITHALENLQNIHNVQIFAQKYQEQIKNVDIQTIRSTVTRYGI